MTDKMREEFEAWYLGIYGPCHAMSINEVFSVDSFGVYALMMPRVAYEAWQASRVAMCVELPVSETEWPDGTLLLNAAKVKQSLSSAGVRYK